MYMQRKMELVDHKLIFGINIHFCSLKAWLIFETNFRSFLVRFKVFVRPERSNSSRNAPSVITRAGTTTGSWSDV